MTWKGNKVTVVTEFPESLHERASKELSRNCVTKCYSVTGTPITQARLIRCLVFDLLETPNRGL
jgi:hypothetical protein